MFSDKLKAVHHAFVENPCNETYWHFIREATAELGKEKVDLCIAFFNEFGGADLCDFCE